MKRFILMVALMAAPLQACVHHAECCFSDSQSDRDRIWNEIHFCIKKMNLCLEDADREAAQISDVDIEKATRSAISGAIAGLSTRNAYGVVITACLNTLGEIAGESYSHYRKSKRHIEDAEYYAYRADELEEELLWGD